MTTQSPPKSSEGIRGSLAEALITLAGTPDDASGIDTQLRQLARLAADTVAAADYASITALRDDSYITVAASSELADAVDQAQYDDQAGPCLQSLNDGAPVVVPDITAMMTWPGFHEAAARLGLHASVSVPLFTGSGAPIAVLNLYGRDAEAMAPLIAGMLAVHSPGEEEQQQLDAGAEDLINGFAEALSVRATIQLAIATIVSRNRTTAADAYRQLRLHAADTGVTLQRAAGMVLTQDLAPPADE
jgi:GAF domain-containing protein